MHHRELQSHDICICRMSDLYIGPENTISIETRYYVDCCIFRITLSFPVFRLLLFFKLLLLCCYFGVTLTPHPLQLAEVLQEQGRSVARSHDGHVSCVSYDDILPVHAGKRKGNLVKRKEMS